MHGVADPARFFPGVNLASDADARQSRGDSRSKFEAILQSALGAAKSSTATRHIGAMESAFPETPAPGGAAPDDVGSPVPVPVDQAAAAVKRGQAASAVTKGKAKKSRRFLPGKLVRYASDCLHGQFHSPVLWRAIAKEATAHAQLFHEPQHIADLLSCFRQLGYRDVKMMNALYLRAVLLEEKPKTGAMSADRSMRLISALGGRHVADEGKGTGRRPTQVAGSGSGGPTDRRRGLALFETHELICVLDAFARLQMCRPVLLKLGARELAKRVNELDAKQISIVLNSFATFPEVGAPLLLGAGKWGNSSLVGELPSPQRLKVVGRVRSESRCFGGSAQTTMALVGSGGLLSVLRQRITQLQWSPPDDMICKSGGTP